MIKHKVKILPVDGKFIGYALVNDEVVKQTQPCKDTISASRELSKLLNEETDNLSTKPLVGKQAQFIVNQTNTSSTLPPVNPLPAKSPPVISRRCCGRG